MSKKLISTNYADVILHELAAFSFFLLLIVLLITLPIKGKGPKEAVKQRAKLDNKYSYNCDLYAIEATKLRFRRSKGSREFFLNQKYSC